MAVNKTIIIGCVLGGIVVIASAAGGAVFASKMEASNIESKTQLEEEEVKFNGWKQKGNDWYYFKDDIGQIGWIQDQDKWYYLNEDGTRAANTIVDGYHLNEDGIRVDTPSKNVKEIENRSSSNDNEFTYNKAIQIAKYGYSSDISHIDFSSSDSSCGYDNSRRKYYIVHLDLIKLKASEKTITIDNLKVFADGTILSEDGSVISSVTNNNMISKDEALKLINQNDANNINKEKMRLEYYGVATKTEMANKRKIYKDANIDEEAYIVGAYFKDDPDIEPANYYVGKVSGRVFFQYNNGGGSLNEMKNNTVIHAYKWINNTTN